MRDVVELVVEGAVFNHETRRTGARGLAAAASCQLLIDLALGTFSAYHCMRRNIGKTWDKVRCMGREEDAISLGWALCIRMRRCSKCGPKIDDDVAELMNQLERNEYVFNAGPRKGEARPTLLI